MQLKSPWGVLVPDGRISFYLWQAGTGFLISELHSAPQSLRAGDVVLIPGACRHSLRNQIDSPDHPFDHLAADVFGVKPHLEADIDSQPARFLFGHLPVQELGFNPLQGRLPSAIQIPADEQGLPPDWAAVLAIMDREQQLQRPGWRAIVRQLTRTLFHLVIRDRLSQLSQPGVDAHSENGNGSSGVTGPSDPAIRLVVGLLHAELGKPWTVTSLARWIHMSRSAFSARFRDVIGQPPLQYLTELRMQRACELLCESNLGIKQIATAVGYESPSSFTNAFKRWRGVSPIGFRLRHVPELAGTDADLDESE